MRGSEIIAIKIKTEYRQRHSVASPRCCRRDRNPAAPVSPAVRVARRNGWTVCRWWSRCWRISGQVGECFSLVLSFSQSFFLLSMLWNKNIYFLVKSEENVSLIKGTEIHRILSRNANMTPSLEYIYIKVYSFFTTCTSGGGSCFHNGSKSSYRNLYSLLSPGPFFSFTRGNTGVWERKIVFIKYYQLHSTSRRNKKVLKVLMEWGEGKIRRKLSAQYVSVYSGR